MFKKLYFPLLFALLPLMFKLRTHLNRGFTQKSIAKLEHSQRKSVFLRMKKNLLRRYLKNG